MYTLQSKYSRALEGERSTRGEADRSLRAGSRAHDERRERHNRAEQMVQISRQQLLQHMGAAEHVAQRRL